MDLSIMKVKLICLLVCMVILLSVFSGATTAKNPVRGNPSVAGLIGGASGNRDVILITDETPDCDIDNSLVVYAGSASLSVYDINTGETETEYVGGDIVFPKISGERVVYHDFIYKGFKMYTIDTGDITELIVTNWSGGDADSFQFFGEYIVYENTDFDLYSTEIFLYNIATGETMQLTDCPGDDYPENPCIYENIVAWQLSEEPLHDIVMYDIESSNYTRVTNTSQFASETSPSIYDDTIVYSYFYYDKVNGTTMYGLKQYRIGTGEEITIFMGDEPTANSPELFGGIVVYSMPDGRLCLYDLITHSELLIYESPYLVQPWNVYEQYVVFTVLDEGVYLYEYETLPVIEIEDITGGLFTVRAVVKNTGGATATDVSWSITFSGGLLILGKESTGTIPALASGATAAISSKFILGFGRTVVTVTADTATASQNATVLFVFIKL